MANNTRKQCASARTTVDERPVEQSTANDDMISNLPDELLLQILTILPTDDTIRTSVLSKRWTSLWKQMEHLKFDNQDRYGNKFGEYVLQAISNHGNEYLKSLTISASRECEPSDLSSWIQMAFLRRVHKLVLRLNNLLAPVTIPPQAFQQTNSLRILKLVGDINVNLTNNSVNFDWLSELHLYHVRFEDELSVSHLLNGCTCLGVLVVELFISSGIRTFAANMPKLQRLTLRTYLCEEENIVITAPCLEYININGLDGVQSCVFENTSYVKEAKIANFEENTNGNLLDITIQATRLSLTSSIMYPAGTVFDKLVALEIDTKTDEWPQLLASMLHSSPKLESLKIIGGTYFRGPTQWNSPNNVARCLLSQFQSIEWYDFSWDAEDDTNVAQYILRNGSQLRNAVFKTFIPTNARQKRQRMDALSQLASVEKASQSCHLVFPTMSYTKHEVSNDQDPDVSEFMN